jgi:hypothetical protein
MRAYARNLFELQSAGSRILPMEGTRGFSALLVFFVHFYSLFGSRAQSPPLADAFLFLGTIGHRGVDVFLVLSGFIVNGILLQKPIGYFVFMRQRVVRLYPVFTTIFVLYVILELTLAPNDRLSGSHPRGRYREAYPICARTQRNAEYYRPQSLMTCTTPQEHWLRSSPPLETRASSLSRAARLSPRTPPLPQRNCATRR